MRARISFFCALTLAALVPAPTSAGPSAPTGQFAFSTTGPKGSLYVMAANGSHLRRLARAYPMPATPVTWAPDGQTLAYLCDDYQLCMIRSNGTGRRVLTRDTWPDLWTFVGSPAWSPDGGKLAFSVSTPALGGSIVVSDLAQSTFTIIATPSAAHPQDLTSPFWRPDGTRVGFSTFRGTSRITGFSLSETSADRRGKWLGLHAGDQGAWSPDGRTLAVETFDSKKHTNWIQIVAGNASARTIKDAKSISIGDPMWSPDGTSIAYIGVRGTDQQLYVHDVSGFASTPVHIPTAGLLVVNAAWGPDPTGRASALYGQASEPHRSAETQFLETRLYLEGLVNQALVPVTQPGAEANRAGRKLALQRTRQMLAGLEKIDLKSEKGKAVRKLAIVEAQAAVICAESWASGDIKAARAAFNAYDVAGSQTRSKIRFG
jgi:dipeptidyl aminopeptidase/acylaminoacyl peptidase